MQQLSTYEEFKTVLESRDHNRIVVFKHSTQCPISAAAHQQVEAFEQNSDVPVYLIRVIEERPLSNQFAAEFGIRHESPQAIVLEHGRVLWHASHRAITSESLTDAVSKSQ